MRRRIREVATITALVLASAAPAAAAGGAPPTVPFRGSAVTVDQPMGPPTDCPESAQWRYTSVGTGNLAHLGKVDVVVTHCSWLTGPTTGAFSAADVVFTAANGDTLTMDHSGTFVLGAFGPDGPTTSDVEGTWTITGGTGRFAGATGSGTLGGVGDLLAGTMPATWDGTMTYAASGRSGR